MMTSMETIKQELWREIDKLPEAKLKEVLQFVSFLHYSQNQSSQQVQEHFSESNPEQVSVSEIDPLSEFIGAVKNGNLANNIDKDLYD